MAIECPTCGLLRFYGPTGLAAPQCMCLGGYQKAATPAAEPPGAKRRAEMAATPEGRAALDAARVKLGLEPVWVPAFAAPHPDTKDAERYRWLRNEAWGGNNNRGPHLVEFRAGLSPSAITELAEEAADAAIDAAMAAQGKESA